MGEEAIEDTLFGKFLQNSYNRHWRRLGNALNDNNSCGYFHQVAFSSVRAN